MNKKIPLANTLVFFLLTLSTWTMSVQAPEASQQPETFTDRNRVVAVADEIDSITEACLTNGQVLAASASGTDATGDASCFRG